MTTRRVLMNVVEALEWRRQGARQPTENDEGKEKREGCNERVQCHYDKMRWENRKNNLKTMPVERKGFLYSSFGQCGLPFDLKQLMRL
jgi:hypothetical protein